MTTALTRLHISPFTPALLDSILAPSIRSLATDISFHTIPTFPENSYGYVSLPQMEANKLKKKLNGSILKGKKLKVEPARHDPKTIKQSSSNDAVDDSKSSAKEKRKKTSKRKAEEDDGAGVLEGYELPDNRQVKRGWTEPASARKNKKQKKGEKEGKTTKSQPKSKYTEKAECLFKTKIPPNKTTTTETGKKDKKSKKGNKSPNEVVVHEFAQTVTHPSFLKSTTQGQPVTAGFEEGKGWVDEDGKIQEPASEKTKKANYQPGKRDGVKERAPPRSKKRTKSPTPVPSSTSESEEEVEEEPDWTSSSGSSESETSASGGDSDSESESDVMSDSEIPISNKEEGAVKAALPPVKKSESVKSTDSGNEGDSESDDGSQNDDSSEDSDSASEKESSSEDNSESPTSSEDVETETKEGNVHPLEALFKRPQSNDAKQEETNAGFSFFGGNDDDLEDEDEEPQPASIEPLTPYTQRDRQIRGIRSAAPTPDTAMRNHSRLFAEDGDDEDMEDADEDSYLPHTDATPSKARDQTAQQPKETDFAKWFWEHRGENNRAWKKRRRDAAKEKRQRENRRKGMKGRG